VAGVGKVGRHLVGHLVQAGASVVVTDPHAPALRLVTDEHPEVQVVASAEELVVAELDVYSPCALGDALTDEVVETLIAQVVCGAANNQLAHPGIEKQLADRGILYAPDYVVNAGGLIQVADELHGFDFERARERAGHIFETTREVFEVARLDGVPPAVAADRIAERRMAEAPGAGRIWLP
jgi:valine dehydrogenase (NAD+)